MNGSYKLALTKFKWELLTILTKKGSGYMQTDIVPLVQKSWHASFAKKEKAKSAIAKGGWNPLNYVLLDHLNLNSSLASRASNQTENITDSSEALSINTEGNKFKQYLNQFIMTEAKREGRKRKLEEQQKEIRSPDENFSTLTDYTRIAASFGSLAKHNIFGIGAGLL
jgi:hypothetical protein